MTDLQRAPRRGLLRPLVVTAEVVALSTAAHAAAGGALPSADRLVLLTCGVGAVSAALHHRLLQPRVAAVVAVLAQLAVHAAGPGPGDHAEHLHAAPSPEIGLPMLAAHAFSALVTVLALVWQEQVLLGAVRRLAPPSPGPRPHGPLTVVATTAHLPSTSVLLLRAPRRGPPRAHASATS